MNKNEVIEMTEIKIKVANIEKTNELQFNLLEKINIKLDEHINTINKSIECKADRIEVTRLESKIDKWTYGVITGLILLLMTSLGFLIKYTLFK